MKKLIMYCLFSLAVSATIAEEYKPFRVDLGIGYAKPKGAGDILFSIEPRYSVIPNLAAGFRLEMAGLEKMVRVIENNTIVQKPTIKITPSFLLTGNYWFASGRFRPYAGAGAGIYCLPGAYGTGFIDADRNDYIDDLNFGAMLSAGIDMYHIRLAVEYNFIGKNEYDNVNYSYLGLKFNVYLGGGRK